MPDTQTPEDDQAELHLRALMPLLDSPAYPEFGNVRSFRDEVTSHTHAAVVAAIQEVCRRFGVPGGGIGITDRANNYLAQRMNAHGLPDPNGTMWAEVIRRTLIGAEEGEFVPGLFSEMWTELCKNASN